LKPENVLIGDHFLPALLDFGSTAAAEVPVTSRRVGLQVQDEASQRCSVPCRAPHLLIITAL
jgi:serine/threonine kinase 16